MIDRELDELYKKRNCVHGQLNSINACAGAIQNKPEFGAIENALIHIQIALTIIEDRLEDLEANFTDQRR